MSRHRKVRVRPGHVLVPAELAARWARLLDYHATSFGAVVEVAAEEEGQDWVDGWLAWAEKVAAVADELGDAAMRAQLVEARVRESAPLRGADLTPASEDA